jgi:hypothetical protein
LEVDDEFIGSDEELEEVAEAGAAAEDVFVEDTRAPGLRASVTVASDEPAAAAVIFERELTAVAAAGDVAVAAELTEID